MKRNMRATNTNRSGKQAGGPLVCPGDSILCAHCHPARDLSLALSPSDHNAAAPTERPDPLLETGIRRPNGVSTETANPSFQYKFCTSPKPNESACLESCEITRCWDRSENKQTQLLELPTEHAQPVSQQEHRSSSTTAASCSGTQPSLSFLYYTLKNFNMLNRTQNILCCISFSKVKMNSLHFCV